MGAALQIPASDFSRRFGQVREAVHKAGVIEVTSHNRVVGAYISVDELEHFNRLKRREVQVLHASEIDDELLTEIENAEYGVISK
ncbi:type II toxin-antitoxin system prevent-host-death family antitoxin [Rhizobium sp. NPDC090275]|jgi:prevent-host-death family protein|uniref:type II toxin-antitoxin system prevent-host-death family antitoxin n=1 Tax=Rhizobium sp. NPDC090275 TaxID=3364498 RepID=UPI000DD8E80A